MTPHLHSTHVPGCYRCDLSLDEMENPAVPRFAIQWNRTTQTWWVTDNEADLAPVAEFDTLLEAEAYCVERGTRTER